MALVSEKGLMEKDAVSTGRPSGREKRFPARFVCFGPFYLDVSREQLFLGESKVNLFGKPLNLLMKILERPNQIVLRDELCRHLWGAEPDTALDANLCSTLNKVRNALGDPTSQPKYIETVRDSGYRFIASVEHLDSCPRPSRDPPVPQTLQVSGLGLALFSRMFPAASAVMVLVTASLVGFGVSFVWAEGIRARSVAGLVLVSMVAAATVAMVSATIRLISRSR